MGRLTYLEAKARGKQSMSGKRWPSGGVRGEVPQDPHDMAKAGLPKTQSPTMKVNIRRNDARNRRRAMLGHERKTGQPPWRAVPSSEDGQGDEWAAYVVLDTYSEDVPRDHLQGASPRVRSAHGSRRSHDRPRGPGKPE